MLDGQRQILQYATWGVANLAGVQVTYGFATCHVANLRRPLGVDLIECPEVTKVGTGEALAVMPCQLLRQCLDQRATILSPLGAALQSFDDLPADVPVGQQHLAIDTADHAPARVVEDRCYPGEKATHRSRQARPCG